MAWLLGRIARERGVNADEIDPNEPFSALGLKSVQAAGISGELEELLGRRLDPLLLFENPTPNALVAHLCGADPHRHADSCSSAGPPGSAVAIVGIGCRFPGARGAEAFWDLLASERDEIVEVPPDRWDVDALYDPDPMAPGRMSTRWGGFLDDVDGFDHRFFGISAAEAEAMDPQQRVLLEVAREAVEDAALAPSSLAGTRTSVFIGISHNDAERLRGADPDEIDAFWGTGNALSVAANRISYHLDLRGPSLAVDTACSSSLVAVHLAVQSLRRGECDAALAGGANLILSPDATLAFSKAGMMSPDGRCKTFDAAANGYVRGEGVGVVVLKRLSAALEARDPIHAVIRGSAVTQDGRTNGLSAPNPAAQEATLRAAYADGGLDPSSVGYVEAHGTGTSLGDPIEAAALGRVVGRGREPASSCWVGSVKTNFGHLEAASGVAGLIKAALAVERRLIPRSLHFDTPNPAIRFEELRLRVPRKLQPFAPAVPARAGVSAFGFGGTNCHVVLEAPPEPEPITRGSGPVAVPISAGDSHALEARVRALESYAASRVGGETALLDLAYTAATGSDPLPHRTAIVASSADQLRAGLRNARAGRAAPRVWVGSRERPTQPRIAWVFSGQGSQYAGMARGLVERFPVFRSVLAACDAALREPLGGSIVEEIMRSEGGRLSDTSFAQPALVSVQIALAELLRSAGVSPGAVIGHSVGEISAAYAAGALDLGGALLLAAKRGAAMAGDPGHGAMLSVPLPAEALRERYLRESPGVEVAAENAPNEVVVSGREVAIEALLATLEADGVAARRLRVEYAFHSAHMEAAARCLEEQLEGFEPRPPKVPFYSTVHGGLFETGGLGAAYWRRNVRERVRFARAVSALLDDGCDVLLEIAPHPVLAPALKAAKAGRSRDARVVATLRREVDADVALLSSLAQLYCAGVDVAWRTTFEGEARKLRLPAYPWSRDAGGLRKRPPAGSPRPRRSGGHPLLGTRAAELDGAPVQLFTNELALERLPFLADHRVAGSIVFPAAGFVEIALSAAVEILPDETAWELRDLEILRPLHLDFGEPARTLVEVRRAPDASHDVAVFARRGAGGDWEPHVRARIASGAQPRRGRGDDTLAAIQTRCLELVPEARFYEQLRVGGLEYGGGFRVVREVVRRDGESLASVDRPAGRGFRLHPVQLDAAFQAIAAALPDFWSGPTPRVPVALARVRWQVPETPLAKGHARLHGDGTDGDAVHADVRLLSADGRVAVEIDRLELRRARSPAHAREARVADAGPAHWLYGESWDRVDAVARPPAERRRWLVLADGGGFALRVARRLRDAGDDTVVVRRRESFSEAGDEGVDPFDSDQVAALVRRTLALGQEPVDGILCCWALDQPESPAGSSDPLVGSASAVSGLVRALASHAAPRPCRLWLLTRGAQAVPASQPMVSCWQAPVLGLGFAIAFEHPDLSCTRLDLDPDPDLDDESARLMAEFARAAPEGDQFALRDGAVRARRIVPHDAIEPSEGATPGGTAVSPDATCLITGGCGALGLSVANRLVDEGARHLILVGRSAPGARARKRIENLERRGASVVLKRLDVADREALSAALEEARRTLPPIRCIVHAAGIVEDGPLAALEPARLERVLQPKVLGAWHLHELTRDDPIDAFVLFSSVAASLGSMGQGAYMAANAFLDALAEKRVRAGLPALAVAWGPWADEGMAAEARALGRGASAIAGISMIEHAAGTRTLLRLMASRRARAIVLPYDLKTLIHAYPAARGLSLFEHLFGEDLHERRSAGHGERLAGRPALDQEYVAPRTRFEAMIAGIWQRALGLEQVGVRDRFFELGGDSVFAGQVLTQINRNLGVLLDSRRAFEEFTVERLAVLAEEALLAAVEEMSDEEAESLLARAGDREAGRDAEIPAPRDHSGGEEVE